MERNNNWESNLFWLILAIVGAYVFLFGFLKKINEWYYAIRLGKNKNNSVPPGDMGWPLIGNMFSLLKAFRSQDPESFVNNMVDRFGRTGIYKTFLFWNPSVIVCNPELCRKVLTDDERFSFSYPSSLMKLVGKKSLHGVSGPEHKRLRKLIAASIYGNDALSMYMGYVEEIVTFSLEDWVNRKSPIEFLTEWKKISTNVITKIFMGADYSVSETTTNYLTDLFQGLSDPLAIDLPGLPFHRAMKARTTLEKMVQARLDVIKGKKIDEVNTKRGMMHQLLEVKDEDGEKLDDQHITNLLLSFLIAGNDTTALAAMWLIIHLHQHQELLQRAKEEQVEITKRRPSSQNGLTLNEIRQMEFLSKAIDESMRLSNIAFINFRKAEVDVEINGYIIPKGWKVLVWHRAVHLNSEIYSNPKEFLPSRWDNYKPKAGSFIPFGAGSRTCPGSDLAKLEISIFFHYFLLNYRFERIDPRSPIKYLTCPRPTDNCLAKITKLP